MILEIHADAIRGSREYQEDSHELRAELDGRPDACLVVLCDGMGGHRGGAIASRTAARTFADVFLPASGATARSALQQALEQAHGEIRRAIELDEAPSDMGTTLVAVFVDGSDVHWISVGDSHLLHFHDGKLDKLNADHSMAKVLDDLVAIGRIDRQEAMSDPSRSVVRSAVSSDEIRMVDLQSRPGILGPGDLLILASDGLDTLPHHVIESSVRTSRRLGPGRVVGALLAEVERAGVRSQDNTTIVSIGARRRFWPRIFS